MLIIWGAEYLKLGRFPRGVSHVTNTVISFTLGAGVLPLIVASLYKVNLQGQTDA